MALALLGMWLFSAIIPPVLFTHQSASPEFWVLIGLAYAYMGYSGVRALRRGRRSRFVLRVVVPLCIFTTSLALVVLGIFRFPD
jgi:hypothetical protein